MGFMAWGRGRVLGGSPDGVAGGRFNFVHGFKALHFENQEPQMKVEKLLLRNYTR